MKLCTSIKPRRDGAVVLNGASGARYVFAANDAGDLQADVTNDDDVRAALALDHFWPADDADMARAEALLKDLRGEEGKGEGEGDPGEDDDEDEVDLNALPVEANTPPSPSGKAKKKGQAAAAAGA